MRYEDDYFQVSRTSGLAVASLVLGLVPVVPVVGSILAIIFGGAARSQIKKGAGRLKGAGMAGWGIALGILGLVGTVVIVVIIAVSINTSMRNSYNNGVASGVAGQDQIGPDINAGGQPPTPQDYCSQQATSDPNPARFYAGCIEGWNNP